MNDNDERLWRDLEWTDKQNEWAEKKYMDELRQEDYEEYLEEVRKQEKWGKRKFKVAMIGLGLLSIEVLIKMICAYIEFISG